MAPANHLSSILTRRIASLISTVVVVIIILALWQYLPTIPSLNCCTFLNRFLISSPTGIEAQMWSITFGVSNGQHGFLWPYLYHTIEASIGGLIVGVFSGYLAGVLLSEIRFLDETMRPIIIFLNTIPRILIIPIIIIIFGFGETSEVVSASIIVFYLVFFNAYQGGRLADPAMINFVRILGAKRMQILTTVRAYNGLLWTVAQLPNATAFSLLGVITAEVLGTGNGIGYLIELDLSEFFTAQLFALIFITAIYGFVLIQVTRVIVRYSLRWNRDVT